MLTIRNLLNKQLDAGVTDSNAVIKTFVIGPLKYAHAIDVASVLRDVYRESMNNNLRGLGQISSPFTGSTRAPTPNLDANGNPKGVTLSLGIDDKTNSLIVACPTPMYEDIKKLVEQMEFAAADTKQTVKIVQVKGVDPALIQQALDVLQGRSSTNRSSSSRSDIGGSSGFSPFSGSSGGSGFRSNFGGAGLIPGPCSGGYRLSARRRLHTQLHPRRRRFPWNRRRRRHAWVRRRQCLSPRGLAESRARFFRIPGQG